MYGISGTRAVVTAGAKRCPTTHVQGPPTPALTLVPRGIHDRCVHFEPWPGAVPWQERTSKESRTRQDDVICRDGRDPMRPYRETTPSNGFKRGPRRTIRSLRQKAESPPSPHQRRAAINTEPPTTEETASYRSASGARGGCDAETFAHGVPLHADVWSENRHRQRRL